MNVKFESFGKLIFESTYPIKADQFSGVSIFIKTLKKCNNCLYLRAYDLEGKNKVINLDSENKWKEYRYSFKDLEIENNEFNGIILYYSNTTIEPFEIYIGNIELIEKRNPPDSGVCFDINGNGGIIPVPIISSIESDIFNNSSNFSEYNTTSNQSDIDTLIINETNSDIEIINDTSIESTIYNYKEINSDFDNITSLTSVNILGIELIEESSPKIIKVNCESFNKINNESMNLLFTSKDNLNSFQTEMCRLPNSEQITSFICFLPDNIPNGEYNLKSPSNNKYSINY